MKLTLPTDSEARKEIPILSGCMNYFPAALAEIAKISVKGDRKHNPENAGNAPVHARGKSMDHGDCIVRHTMDIEDMKAAIARSENQTNNVIFAALIEEAAYRAWRSCAELQQLCETYAGAPLAPAARLPAATQSAVTGRLLSGGRLIGDFQADPAKFPELIAGVGAHHFQKALGSAGVGYNRGHVNETGQRDAQAREQRSVDEMKARVAENEKNAVAYALERGD